MNYEEIEKLYANGCTMDNAFMWLGENYCKYQSFSHLVEYEEFLALLKMELFTIQRILKECGIFDSDYHIAFPKDMCFAGMENEMTIDSQYELSSLIISLTEQVFGKISLFDIQIFSVWEIVVYAMNEALSLEDLFIDYDEIFELYENASDEQKGAVHELFMSYVSESIGIDIFRSYSYWFENIYNCIFDCNIHMEDLLFVKSKMYAWYAEQLEMHAHILPEAVMQLYRSLEEKMKLLVAVQYTHWGEERMMKQDGFFAGTWELGYVPDSYEEVSGLHISWGSLLAYVLMDKFIEETVHKYPLLFIKDGDIYENVS